MGGGEREGERAGQKRERTLAHVTMGGSGSKGAQPSKRLIKKGRTKVGALAHYVVLNTPVKPVPDYRCVPAIHIVQTLAEHPGAHTNCTRYTRQAGEKRLHLL